jgi:hypothetical protein
MLTYFPETASTLFPPVAKLQGAGGLYVRNRLKYSYNVLIYTHWIRMKQCANVGTLKAGVSRIPANEQRLSS